MSSAYERPKFSASGKEFIKQIQKITSAITDLDKDKESYAKSADSKILKAAYQKEVTKLESIITQLQEKKLLGADEQAILAKVKKLRDVVLAHRIKVFDAFFAGEPKHADPIMDYFIDDRSTGDNDMATTKYDEKKQRRV